MKTYSVWVKVSIEEHDDETDKYRDVGLDFETGEIYDEPDSDEFKILEAGSIEEADTLAQSVMSKIEEAEL